MISPSELIINKDGSVFHLHLRPEQLADRVILVGDPARVSVVANRFEAKECEVSSREFHTITGRYQGKRITVVSHGIGSDNIDIVLNDALLFTVWIYFQNKTIIIIQITGPWEYNLFLLRGFLSFRTQFCSPPFYDYSSKVYFFKCKSTEKSLKNSEHSSHRL